MVEFAFVSIVLLMLLFGIVDMGRALFAYDFVSQAARRATRFAMVRGKSCSGLSGGCPATSDDIQTYVKSIAPGLIQNSIHATSVCIGGSSGTPPCDVGASIRTTVSYDFSFFTPLPTDLIRSWTMHSRSQIVVTQ